MERSRQLRVVITSSRELLGNFPQLSEAMSSQQNGFKICKEFGAKR